MILLLRQDSNLDKGNQNPSCYLITLRSIDLQVSNVVNCTSTIYDDIRRLSFACE